MLIDKISSQEPQETYRVIRLMKEVREFRQTDI